mgnify:CR=1 FL=1
MGGNAAVEFLTRQIGIDLVGHGRQMVQLGTRQCALEGNGHVLVQAWLALDITAFKHGAIAVLMPQDQMLHRACRSLVYDYFLCSVFVLVCLVSVSLLAPRSTPAAL